MARKRKSRVGIDAYALRSLNTRVPFFLELAISLSPREIPSSFHIPLGITTANVSEPPFDRYTVTIFVFGIALPSEPLG